jgi:copper chaperone CopZ
MKQTYSITGMTCNGCKASVEKDLSAIDGVTVVSVNLEAAEGTVTMNDLVSAAVLQKALKPKFTISKKQMKNVLMSSKKLEEKSKLAQLKPLFLIFAFITTAAILMHREDFNIREMMLDFMGLFYIVFSFFKLLDLKGFPVSFKMYDPLAKVIPVYAIAYPFIELALGIMFLLRFEISIALITTLVILGITTIGVTKTLLSKKKIQCACLGTALKLPMTQATFIENTIMITMAIVLLLNIG